MDVVFLMDISGSVQEEYLQSTSMARRIVLGFDIDHDLVRVGAIAFSDNIVGKFFMNSNIGFNSKQKVYNSFDFYPAFGATNTP